MKVLLIGGDGLVGSALRTRLQCNSHNVISTSRRTSHVPPPDTYYLDFRDLSLAADLFSPFTNVVYLVAAVTKVVDCEAMPAQAWRVNADAPAHLALLAKKNDIFTVFMSSDAVERAPNLNYSRQKAYVETLVLSLGGAVVRPSRIPEDRVDVLCALLEDIGKRHLSGVHRWTP